MSKDCFPQTSCDKRSVEVVHFCPHTLRETFHFSHFDKERYVFQYNFTIRFVLDKKELLALHTQCIDKLLDIFIIKYIQSRFKKCFINIF